MTGSGSPIAKKQNKFKIKNPRDFPRSEWSRHLDNSIRNNKKMTKNPTQTLWSICGPNSALCLWVSEKTARTWYPALLMDYQYSKVSAVREGCIGRTNRSLPEGGAAGSGRGSIRQRLEIL
ncbi:hypothetical protein TNIN_136961 [Trichonephila inaurata madagascariensis]|uniref:Uncharacterized protein n=1 Tax=Trichonephila inaurata madagascariensis TaxID=2747483 RepID=A0A8X6M9M4_9ARAC|nr:hypothetical protein TNIN_136961 [Trichonephila inaurata madagascariensis]